MATGSFDHVVNSKHRGLSSNDIAQLGVDALKGVSAGDKQHLHEAFGIETVADLAAHRFVRQARAIHEDAQEMAHDPGPDVDWTAFFATAPLGAYQAHPSDFRLDFGPIYYRGRLDGTARVLMVGQDPAANELVAHRAFVGASGQRVQGFLRRIGIRRDYIMVNAFLYPVFGQFIGSLAQLSRDPDILGYRNAFLDRLTDRNPIEAVIAVGGAAKDAMERWPGSAAYLVQHITHPAAHDHAALLSNWNAGLSSLRAAVTPEIGAPVDSSNYGVDFVDADDEPIPRRDLAFGMPEWHGVGNHATRARLDDGSTDHKGIIWQAP